MAVTKTHPIKSTLKAAIDYICNPDKTDGKLLVSSFGCTAETADIEFEWTRRHSIDKGTHLGRHLIQAFEPGEVSPEEAHEIGMQLAKEILGGKYEFVLTTHIDKEHIHNHLIFNAVSFTDHKHYHSNKHSYHEIRRASDHLCREHGLSVIVPSQDKGKSYIEHQAAQNGTSYKAKLKAAIDRLIPASSSLEDLLARLQREGYEIKRGKYISARAPDQERFTRLKTLGADYTEEAVAVRIAGGPRPSRQPRQRSGKVSLLIDIQNNIKAQQSAGYQRWATIENLKRAAATMNFLTEHGIGSYEELVERCDAIAAASIRTRESLRDVEQQITDLALLSKQIDTYRKLKPIYDRYKASKDKEKFLRGFESEIILFEAAAREIKKAGLTKLPSAEKLKAELDGLTARKTALQRELRNIQREEKEFNLIQKNIGIILNVQKQKEKSEPELF
ncbi:relaxase/mobilization nuclease domain-containing protein [Massilicoli timonensis]|uniref:relaxase/mobilization nuclease domain-containing protein n=1 Tax=Massilicoli timonensis TaxID=2015901 RepID=UPI003AAF45CD